MIHLNKALLSIKDPVLHQAYLPVRKILKAHSLYSIEKVDLPEANIETEPHLFQIASFDMLSAYNTYGLDGEYCTTSFPLEIEERLIELLNVSYQVVTKSELNNLSSSPITKPNMKQTDMYMFSTIAPLPLPTAGAALSLGSRLSRALGDQFMEIESQQDTGPVSSSICMANKEASYTLSTDREPGQSDLVVEIKTYQFNKIKKEPKKTWWKYADTRATYVIPKGDVMQTQVENMVIRIMEKIREDPDHTVQSRKKFTSS